MADTEHSCRICRGEATESQPLIHPCRCRGSIKYIHQDCLMEWLNHSNKSTKQCDICNTPYKFRTIYDPNMPSLMPMDEVWRKSLLTILTKVVRNLSILLYGICIIHIPLFWKFVSRVFTYALDGKLPQPDLKISHLLLYGAYTTRARNGALLSGPDATFKDKLEVFVFNTFVSGLVDILAFVVILFVIFIEHEWVVREEGYTKLLLRHIGKEPRTKLADLLSLMLQQGGENEAARELMMNRALEDLHNVPDLQRHEAALRRALDQGEYQELFFANRNRDQDQIAASNQQNVENEGLNEIAENHPDIEDHGAFNPHIGETSEENFTQHGLASSTLLNGEFTAETRFAGIPSNNSYDSDIEEQQNPPWDIMEPIANTMDDNEEDSEAESTHDQPQVFNLNENAGGDESDNETPEELERRRNLAEDEMAAAEAANNGDILELLGIHFNLTTPIQLMILADFIVLVFLFCIYLVPHFMGNMATLIFLAVCIGIYALVLKPVLAVLPINWIASVLSLTYVAAQEKMPLFGSLSGFIMENQLRPAIHLVTNLGRLDKVDPPTFTERVILLFLGYSLICGAVYLLMTTLVAGKKPVMGTPRRIFKVLFQVVATAKVFTIFAIEIVLFPIYCGWLLDFCFTPLFTEQLVSIVDSEKVYSLFYTANLDFSGVAYLHSPLHWLWNPYLRPLFWWVAGTSYMFFIALFVGMVRNHILRPGVLFFIKSPEDPNARLIHDAIVKPFLLQTLRIFLSAKVYTAFIILGIGSITWGVRYMLNPPGATGKDSTLLPIKFYGITSALHALVTLLLMIRAKPLISKFCKKFWTRAFEAMCHKLRLSHFILGHPVAQERGSVVYRNSLHSILKMSVPDYSRPVSYAEAMEIFKTDPTVNACFVPDGYYVRAPGTDDNSRKFLRGLFVPVTKSDKLLQPVAEVADDEDTDWWDADIVYEDTYTVVYQPPHLKFRCIVLVCLICLFGALLIMVAVLVAVLLGRPITRAAMIATDFMSQKIATEESLPSSSMNWSYIDISSLCLGLKMELAILLLLDYHFDADGAANFVEEQQRIFLAPANILVGELTNFPLFLFLITVPATLGIHLNFNYLTKIEEYFLGTATFQVVDGSLQFNFSWAGILLHLALLPWTFLPHINVNFLNHLLTTLKKKAIMTVGAGGFVALHHLFIFAQNRAGKPLGASEDIHLRILVLAMIVFTRTAVTARGFLASITDQIKKEKYVKGSAIENIDSNDSD